MHINRCPDERWLELGLLLGRGEMPKPEEPDRTAAPPARGKRGCVRQLAVTHLLGRRGWRVQRQ